MATFMRIGDHRHTPHVEKLTPEVASAIQRICRGVVVEKESENENAETGVLTGVALVNQETMTGCAPDRADEVTDDAIESAKDTIGAETQFGENVGVSELTLYEVARIAIELSMEEAAKDWTKAMAVWMLWFDQVCSPSYSHPIIVSTDCVIDRGGSDQ